LFDVDLVMNYKKTIYSEPIEVDFLKCDFPGCTKETQLSSAIDNPYWCGHQGRTFCRTHYEMGKFLFEQGSGKLWVTHKIEHSDKMIGQIMEILPDEEYKIQWYFDGKKLSDPQDVHASVLTILLF
jgi:hypothetical protein